MKYGIICALLIVMLMMPLASAQINFGLGTDRIDNNLVEGEVRDVPAKIGNEGQCDIDCTYRSPGFEEKAVENLHPGEKFPFMAKFKVPGCAGTCPVTIEVICTEQPVGNSCTGKFNRAATFEIMNVMPPGSQGKQVQQAQQGEKMPVQDSNGKEPEPTAAEKVGNLIGIILVILAFLAILFGFLWLILKGIKHLRKSWGDENEKKKGGEEGRRKLSAIMFTDMKGYSREMGKDEEATLKKIWRYEKAMKEIIKEHDGRVVKTIGDAIMGDFDSAVNAVKAAMGIQSLLKKEDIQIRIGIHLGDVIHKAGDVFGDGVNIASRIESICEPGKIYVSEDVYNQVKGKIHGASFESLGSRPLKNIDSPPKVYRIK